MAIEMAISMGALRLEHPIVNGSGTFDAIAAQRAFGDELLERFPFSAFVSKTITPERRDGNPPPRLWETPSGLINSIGLPNKGLDGFIAEDLPALADLPVPLIVSVMATEREEFARLTEEIGNREEVGAIELNVSCPNVRSGLIVGADPEETLALMGSVRELTAKPLIVKLTPNIADPRPVAIAAEKGGADAVSLLNTLRAYAVHPSGGGAWLGGETGGLSGPAIRSVGLAQLRGVAGELSIPIIGMGGIATGADALDYLLAGASAVAVGTESFRDPAAAQRISSELQAELEGRGATSIEDFCKERRGALRVSTARI